MRLSEYIRLGPWLIQGDSATLLGSYNRAQTLHAEYTGTTPLTSVPPSATTALANRRVFDKVWEEVQRLVAVYRTSIIRKLKDSKAVGGSGTSIDSMLDGIEFVPSLFLAYGSLLISLDEPIHPLPGLITHRIASITSSALSTTERHCTQIEILRRRLAAMAEPSAATRRLTYLQGIAKATDTSTDTSLKESKSDLDEQGRRGWDIDAVEDMWSAVVTYVQEMGRLLGDLVGLKDIVDRAVDKSAVLP
jgi:hypothetical protein